MTKKKISIVTPCYNEAENVNELYQRVAFVMASMSYDYEHIFIDNCSTDMTVSKLKEIAEIDTRVKLIINARNFGHIRSPYYAMLQANGDAVILIASDLQDPPEMMQLFLKNWENGYKIVLAVKPSSEESAFMFRLRSLYYKIITYISEVPLIKNATGAGLFDRAVIEVLKKIDDPYPYFRGLICEIGFPIATVEFNQPKRIKGVTKNNFYTLYDMAMLGVVKHSKVPLRIMTMIGFLFAILSILASLYFFVAKIIFWNSFEVGIAPLLISLFFFNSIILMCLGLLGEYIGSIYTQVRKLPLVIEVERVNFD